MWGRMRHPIKCDVHYKFSYASNVFLIQINPNFFALTKSENIKEIGHMTYLLLYARSSIKKNFFSKNVTYITAIFP